MIGQDLTPARVEQHLLAGEASAPGLEALVDGRLLAGDQGLGAGGQVRGVDDAGEVAERLGDVRHAVEAALEPGRAEALLELAGHVHHGLGADHHVDLGAVHGLHVAKARVAREGAQHPQAQLVEQGQHVPQLASDVVLAHQGHVVDLEAVPFDARRHRVGLAGAADMLHHRLAGDAVAQVLGPVEARGVHWHHRGAPALSGLLAHGLDVVADQRRDAGVVDEHRRRTVAVDGLLDGMEEALLTPAHHNVLLR